MSAPAEYEEVAEAFSNAFGRSAVEGWSASALSQDATAGATHGLFRATHGSDSLVLKVIGTQPRGHPRWRVSTDERHPYYWKRESLAYGSGITDGLDEHLRGPRVFGAFDRSDDEVALWLEDVHGVPATAWPVERYGLAARHLGRAQGRFTTDRSLPDEKWWSRGWLREYLARHEPATCDPAHATTRAARVFPSEMFVATQTLWDEREWFLSMMDALPRTLCHLDAWTLNLFADEGDRTVLIDWAYAGIGAVGEDIANMFPDAFFDGFVQPTHLPGMETAIFEGYVAGLGDVGADVEPDLLRLGFAAAAALKYVWIVPHMFAWAEDPAADHAEVMRVAERRLPVMRRLFELANDARTLASTHGI